MLIEIVNTNTGTILSINNEIKKKSVVLKKETLNKIIELLTAIMENENETN
jgi:hypothetical protein